MDNKNYDDLSGKDEELKKKLNKDIAEAIKGVDPLNIDENVNEEELKKQVNEIVGKANKEEKKKIVIPEEIKKEEVDYNKYDEIPKGIDLNYYEETSKNIDYNNYNTEEAIKNGKDKKGVNFVVLFLIVIAIVIFITMFLGTTLNFQEKTPIEREYDKKVTEIQEGKTYTFGKDKKNFKDVEFEMEEDYLGNHILLITNKSDIEYKNRKVYLIFTDEKNNVITVKDEYINYMPINSTVAIEIFEIENKFEDYLVYFDTEVDEYDDYYDYKLQGLGFSEIEVGEYGASYYTVKNTTDEKIDNASFIVLLYNGEDLVFFEEEYIYDLKAGKEESQMIYVDEEIEFTEAKFIINSIKFK